MKKKNKKKKEIKGTKTRIEPLNLDSLRVGHSFPFLIVLFFFFLYFLLLVYATLLFTRTELYFALVSAPDVPASILLGP